GSRPLDQLRHRAHFALAASDSPPSSFSPGAIIALGSFADDPAVAWSYGSVWRLAPALGVCLACQPPVPTNCPLVLAYGRALNSPVGTDARGRGPRVNNAEGNGYRLCVGVCELCGRIVYTRIPPE